MRDDVSRIKSLSVLLICILWLLSPWYAVAAQWPDRDFRVFMEEPGGKKHRSAVSVSVVTQIEAWLKIVAQEYEKMGFKEPTWDRIDDKNTPNEAYKVYVYPDSAPNARHAAMLNPCAIDGSGQWIKIPTFMIVNSLLSVKNGQVTTKGFQDMAHELFHAVQNSYSLFTGDCSKEPGYWIREGTAEAVGIEMARKLTPVNVTPNHFCQIGVRQYSKRLYVRLKSLIDPLCGQPRGYQTQSFWQFLGEYATRKLFNKSFNQWDWVEPDFRYLHDFFNITEPMGSQSKDLLWLKSALYKASTKTIQKKATHYWFSNKLLPVYSRFAGAFSSYWKPNTIRRALYPNSTNGNTQKKWLKSIFGACEPVTVNKGAPASTQRVNFKFWPVSARCLKVKFVGFNNLASIPLTFSLHSSSTNIESTHFGISLYGGDKVIRGRGKDKKIGKIGSFTTLINTNWPMYFIISYVPTDLSGTSAISATIEIASTSVSGPLAPGFRPGGAIANPTPNVGPTATPIPIPISNPSPVPNRSAPVTPTHSPSPIQLLNFNPTHTPIPIPISNATPTSGPSNVEELDTAWKSGSWSGKVHQLEGRPCTVRPFEANGCGPVTQIHMELVSGASLMLDEAMDPSMSLDRRAAIADAFVKRGPGQLPSDMAQSIQKIRKLDGWRMTIAIPQIQPGFTGTIQNAHISVDKAYVDGKPNGSYTVSGPWVGACPGGYYPAIGQVTITEFSKTSISGTFSGQLSDGGGSDCGPLNNVRLINSQFTLTKILWGKTLPPPVVSDDDLIDEQVNDVNEVLPGLIGEEMRDHIKDKASKERQKQKQRQQQQAQQQARQNAQGKLFTKCDCQCHLESTYCTANPKSQCCQACDPLFRMCKNLGPKTHASPAQEHAEVQAMRNTYQAYLDFKMPNKTTQSAMLKQFDLLTTQQKRMFMMGIPQK